ncbi:helix-turn-helix domain-containing protein [Candidatus Parcubacteria bacterium]|nr:MAG: helix-turn-helix domain-containing protein [Candidatus Parcubacteria bacterium]
MAALERKSQYQDIAVIPVKALTDRRLPPRDITVYAALSAHITEPGWCSPSLSRIGRMLGITRQAVQKSVRRLEEFGYLMRHARFEPCRGGDRQSTNRYRLKSSDEGGAAWL